MSQPQSSPVIHLRRGTSLPKPTHPNPSSLRLRLRTQPQQPTMPLLRQFIQKQQVTSIQDTVKKIDEVLLIFSNKVRHANYLQEIKYIYIKRLDNMEKEIKDLKLEKKVREMERSQKETIDELIRRNLEYKEESDRFVVVIHQIRRKVHDMEKYIKTILKENQRLKLQNQELLKKAKINFIKETEMKRMALGQAIDRYLKEEQNQQAIIYNFIKDNEQIPEEDFFRQLGRFVDSLIGMSYRKSRSPNRLPNLSYIRSPRVSSRPKLSSQNKLKKTPLTDIFS